MAENRPTRPLHLRFFNAAARYLGLASPVSLDPAELVRTAMEDTGLEDFGPETWRDGFERLCESLQEEARLTAIGRLSARSHVLQLLRNRLQIEANRKRDTAVAGQPIEWPVIITGLPRSGSTLLHGLLAEDPQLRAPLTWEVMFPSPPPGADAASDRARIKKSARALKWVDRLAPDFRAVHPVGAHLPQECIAITANEFASVEFHTTFDVPAYQRWLDEQQQVAAMRYHERFLQQLQAYSCGRRWLLKAPAHLYTLPELRTVYPGARFVITHRDPARVVASIASHGVILRSAFSNSVDAAAVSEYWMHWWAEGWRRAAAFRRENPDTVFVDLDYRDLVSDPLGVLERLYSGLGLTLSGPAADRMREYLNANPQDKHGRHRYSLDQLTLGADEIRSLFEVA